MYVEYRDLNPPTSPFPNAGGPLWNGFVDTDADDLTITAWSEIPGSVEFWTPLWTPTITTLPLVWPAVDSSGAPFDVPEDFDGHINSQFAFISTVSARNMLWNEGTFSPLVAELDFYPGWGGLRRPIPGANPVQFTFDTSANERSMPWLPSDEYRISESTLATVTASDDGPAVAGVPEAGAGLLLSVAGVATCILYGVRRSFSH